MVSINEDDIMHLIRLHNRVIDVLAAAKMTCDFSSAGNVWGALCKEGANIASMAQKFELDAALDIENGKVSIRNVYYG